jgi:hypothetical protein
LATERVGFVPVGIDLIVIGDQVWYSDPVRRNWFFKQRAKDH